MLRRRGAQRYTVEARDNLMTELSRDILTTRRAPMIVPGRLGTDRSTDGVVVEMSDVTILVPAGHDSAPLPAQPTNLPLAATVLLTEIEHKVLAQWCREASARLSGRVVTPHEVLRALVARLVCDARLAADLLADLRAPTTMDDIRRYTAW
jgi:hypothetical protein